MPNRANEILRIAIWNANGLANHRQEIITFLDLNKVDVLLISETHFTSRTVFSIPYYSVYHTIHPDGTAHGGSAVIIKNSICHYEQEKFQTDPIQATTVSIRTSTGHINIAISVLPTTTYHIDRHIQRVFRHSWA